MNAVRLGADGTAHVSAGRLIESESTEGMRDSAGRPWSVFLEPFRAIRYARPCEDSTPVPPGHWQATKRVRAAIRRAERKEADL